MSKPASEILAVRSGSGGMTFGQFFRNNAKAREFALEWLRMRAEGTTDWSANRLGAYLREHFKCPLKSKDALLRWLREQGECSR